jgi:hypothetical protein
MPLLQVERLWQKHRERWTRDHPWLGGQERFNVGKRTFGLGCYICSNAGKSGPFSSFTYTRLPLDRSLFKQHEATAMHKAASGDASVSLAAPSTDAFKQVLDAVRQRSSSRAIGDVGHRKKIRKMSACLGEAARHLDRCFWRRCKHMTLMQDVRKGKLLVRFRASAPGMEVRSGIMGQCRLREGGALNLRDATLEVLTNACKSRRSNVDRQLSEGRLDRELLDHLLSAVKFFTADAAGDEQTACARDI